MRIEVRIDLTTLTPEQRSSHARRLARRYSHQKLAAAVAVVDAELARRLSANSLLQLTAIMNILEEAQDLAADEAQRARS